MIYVVGFYFDNFYENVALIRKKRPEWQKGKLNGIGGKVEIDNNESFEDAMHREFKEETGADVYDWDRFCHLRGDWGEVQFFVSNGNLHELASVTDEPIEIYSVTNLPENVIPNLRWLIPMAMEPNSDYQVDESQ